MFSVSAFAGLAVAIVFTWKIFPSAPQRRQPKRRPAVASDSGNNLQINATVDTSVASASSEDLRAQDVVDDFFQPVKVFLSSSFSKFKLCVHICKVC